MSKLKIHTVEQPDSDTTCFVLSCNRLDVLDKIAAVQKDQSDRPLTDVRMKMELMK